MTVAGGGQRPTWMRRIAAQDAAAQIRRDGRARTSHQVRPAREYAKIQLSKLAERSRLGLRLQPRKVRAPQSTVPGNARSGVTRWNRATEKRIAARKRGEGETVR